MCVRSGRARPFKAASESGRGVSVSTLVYGPTGLATLWLVMVLQQQWTVAKPVGLERDSVWVEAGRGRWNPTSSSRFNSIQRRMEVTLTADSCRWLSACMMVCLLAPKLKPLRVALACDGKVENQSDGCLIREVTYQTLAWAESDPNPGFKKEKKKRIISGCLWQAPAHSHPQWTAR